MKELGLWLIDKITAVFPGLLLRIVYPPHQVAKQVIIELIGETPIRPTLNAKVPQIDLWLVVINQSNLDLILDRMLIDLWFGQPTLKLNILERYRIPARSINRDIYIRSDLTEAQSKQIAPYCAQSQSTPIGGGIRLEVHAYFTTKVGEVEVKTSFQRTKV